MTLDKETIIALILKTEPDFLTQAELQINGFGSVRAYTAQEDIWVWKKEEVRAANETTLAYLIDKIVS